MKIQRKSSPGRGFTLMELMVAMTITTIIVSVLVSITSIALDTWNRSRSELRASRQAKSMIDTMGKDFESLVVRKGNTNQWLSSRTPTNLEGSNSFKSTNAAEMEFFTAVTDRYNGEIGVANTDLGGDVSCVAYRLAYKDPITKGNSGDFKTFVLYRKLANPDVTFKNLFSSDLKSAFSTEYKDSEITSAENFICENVFQFTVTFNVKILDLQTSPPTSYEVPVSLVASGSDPNQVSDFAINGTGIEIKTGGSSYSAGTKSFTLSELQAGKVTSVQLSISAISDFGIDQLAKRTFTGDQKSKFISQNSYQFTKLIQVPNN